MTDLLKIFANDKRIVTYRPEWRNIAGSVTASILLSQIIYWWDKSNREPFYKFRCSCNHDRYRAGDSWCEELGFSGTEFDSAIRKIGQKAKLKDLESIRSGSSAFVFYWTSIDRLTFYDLNAEHLSATLAEIYVIKDSSITYSGKPELHNPAIPNLNKRVCIIETETTDRDYCKGKPSPPHSFEEFKAIMPVGFESEQVNAIITDRLTKKTNTVAEISEALAYSTAHCSDTGKYKSYFGKALDGGYGAGFLADTDRSVKTTLANIEEMKKAEQILIGMRIDDLKELARQIEEADVLPFLEKRIMWEQGALSLAIREKVLNYLIKKGVTQ